jgi:hypothetical protein
LFLGNFVSHDGRPSLWELNSDFYLHNEDLRDKGPRRRYSLTLAAKDSYVNWFDHEHLKPLRNVEPTQSLTSFDVGDFDAFYQTSELTSLHNQYVSTVDFNRFRL